MRCQISSYKRSWSRLSTERNEPGVRRICVGRIASWASCALRERVLYLRGPFAKPVPYSRSITSCASASACADSVTESVRM